MPAHFDLAQEVLQGSPIGYTGYPIGYPAFLVLALKCGGLEGVFVAQALLYLGILLLAYRILRSLGVEERVAFWVSGLLGLHPYLILNIKRIVDSNLAVFLMVAFVYALMELRKKGLHLIGAVGCGLLFGYMVLDRQNMLSVLPLAFVALFYRRKRHPKEILLVGLLALTALGTMAMVTIPIKGRFSVLQTYYGAYNFFAGANPHTFSELIRNYDAEYSIGPALADLGLPSVSFGRSDPKWKTLYLRLGTDYIRQHPWKYGGLTLFKILTFFRPDYRRSSVSGLAPSSVVLLVQTLLALPLPVWLYTRWRTRGVVTPLQGPMAVPLFFLWLIPFAFSNVDPRLRLPMDVVLILDAAYGWNFLRRNAGVCLKMPVYCG